MGWGRGGGGSGHWDLDEVGWDGGGRVGAGGSDGRMKQRCVAAMP